MQRSILTLYSLWLLVIINLLASIAAAQTDSSNSVALFEQIYSVLSHPRCTNCHTVKEDLRAGNGQYQHLPPVPRGENGFGDESQPCSKCHRYQNTPTAPGAVIWQAPPLSMGWYGLSAKQLCETLTDRSKNGDRDLYDLEHHMRSSPSVLWAWEPGGVRTPPPLPFAEFRRLFSQWIESGAECPP